MGKRVGVRRSGVAVAGVIGLVIGVSLTGGCSLMNERLNTAPGLHHASARVTLRKELAFRYLAYLPDGYEAEAERRWPLVLFLHGAGERGDDLNKVALHGPPRRIQEGERFPFILVAPQCPADAWWEPETLIPFVDYVESAYRVDRDRIYVTGLSMGGFGTWGLALAQPERFAAIAPVCGGGLAFYTRRIPHLPVWVFHGARDSVVPLSESERMVEALRRYGGNVKFTVYPDADHDSWTETYANPELYAWLLAQRRGAPAR